MIEYIKYSRGGYHWAISLQYKECPVLGGQGSCIWVGSMCMGVIKRIVCFWGVECYECRHVLKGEVSYSRLAKEGGG